MRQRSGSMVDFGVRWRPSQTLWTRYATIRPPLQVNRKTRNASVSIIANGFLKMIVYNQA